MAKRLYMTNADYVAIAISPALVMTLVGSLVFFLIEVLYVGDYQARLTYAFGLFVFAAVFPDADLSHRIVLAPALVAVLVAAHLFDTREKYRRPASIALVAVLVLSAAQLLRSAALYLTAG